MAEALRIIKERDGWKGLRRGMGPRIMTVAPSTAISWLSYEFFSESIFGLGSGRVADCEDIDGKCGMPFASCESGMSESVVPEEGMWRMPCHSNKPVF
jgi:hypothetical protein